MEQKEFYSGVFRSLGCLKLWQARHSMVLDFLEEKQVKTMMDLGTSQSTLLMKVQRGLTVRKMIGLDIDDEALHIALDNIRPEGIQNDFQYAREYDQEVSLYKGSALQKYPQFKKIQFDLITLVEVVEHIHEKYLPQLNDNVFGYLKPKWVWMSTPNSQFNQLFKWADPNRKYRHDDHKFEWTRKQFQDYVDQICEKYNYQATMTGVGLAAQDENLDKGFCTQIAIFERLDNADEKMEPETGCEEFTTTNQSKKQTQVSNPSVPLELKHEHINLSWKSNVEHLLTVAMKEIVSMCETKDRLSWYQATQSLKKKMIIKTLKEYNNEWGFDYHLKNFVYEFFKNHREFQIYCSKEGIRQINPKMENQNESMDLTMLDQEFEKEMNEWKNLSREESEMLELKNKALREPEMTTYQYDSSEPLFRRRSAKNKKSKSKKSQKAGDSSSSQSNSNQSFSSSQSSSSQSSSSSGKSQDSWGSVELPAERQKRRIRRRPIARVQNLNNPDN